jgi:hypothetical protein
MWIWFEVFLILGGAIVTLGGLVWHKTSVLTSRVAGRETSNTGFYVMLAGCAMFGLGWLFGYLFGF